MNAYGQFCPVSKASELLDERWTLLVIRELLTGSTRFNEISRGVPRMSPTLLSRRLKDLVRAGVVERVESARGIEYLMTKPGEELRPIVEAIGAWGTRWIPELGEEDYDPHLLMWDMRRRVDLEVTPEERVVLHFTFSDVRGKPRNWWLVIEDDVDLCDEDLGFEDDLHITCDLKALVRIWRGDIAWTDAMGDGRLRVEGRSELRRELTNWLQLSPFAVVPRPDESEGVVHALQKAEPTPA